MICHADERVQRIAIGRNDTEMTLDGQSASQTLAAEASATAREKGNPLAGRIRFQLGGALIAGVLLPLLLRWPIDTLRLEIITDRWQTNSAIAATASILLGFFFVRQFIVFPGSRAATYILPSLSASFGLVALVFFFARIDYSRYMFGASYFFSLGWLFASFFLRNRYAQPRLAVLPAGNLRGIAGTSGATWHALKSPADNLSGIEAIVADLRSDLPPAWERFIARCVLAGIPVYDVKNVAESLTGRVEIEHLSESGFGTVLPSKLYIRVKRLLDLLLALVLAVPFAVFITIAAICIRLESKGHIIFTQPRMGYRGHRFTIYKLRSMYIDVVGGEHFTADHDPRITRVGHFIRKYRIDELPQICNIIRGDMSWIGPRPEAIKLADWYARDIPFYIYRHAVRPGISGWAQINQGNVARVEAATMKLQYDFFYIKNFSPWLDLLITIKTLRTILTGFGSI